MARKGKPITPRSTTNPIGQARRMRLAVRAVRRDLRDVQRWLLASLEAIPAQQEMTVNQRYDYTIDVAALRALVEELRVRLGIPGADEMVDAARSAYQEGTAMAATNLSGITDEYTRDVTEVLASSQYQARAALAGARVFEEMKGFAGKAAADLARVLMTGIEQGESPVTVARRLRKQFKVTRSRAERIARTEIPGALRRGRMDEAETAERVLGVKVKLLWFSALTSTTRRTHASRHGETYDVDEVRSFYSRDANGINCLCSQVEVIDDGDESGVPKKVQERTKRQKAKWRKEQEDA